MYHRRHKRTKTHNELNDNIFIPKVSALQTEYPNSLHSTGVLQRFNNGNYGSVTNDYETLHGQRMHLISYLSEMQPSYTNTYSRLPSRTANCTISPLDMSTVQNWTYPNQNVESSTSPNIIDLEGDYVDGTASPVGTADKSHGSIVESILQPRGDSACNMDNKASDDTNGPPDSCLKDKEENDSASLVIIDSDDEDANHKGGNKHLFHPHSGAFDFRAWVQSNIKNRLKQAMTRAQKSHNNQLVPYEQRNSLLVGNFASRTNWQPSVQYQKVVLQKVPEEERLQDVVNVQNENPVEKRGDTQAIEALYHRRNIQRESCANLLVIPTVDKQEHPSTLVVDQKDEMEPQSDGLDDLWNDMQLAMESSKIDETDKPSVLQEEQEEEECNHSYLLQDDLGLVCRICGVIQKSIETIFDYQWKKGTRAARAYLSAARAKEDDDLEDSDLKVLQDDFIVADISIHPRHLKQMRPHQLEGFNFLVKNLITDKPGGCILAHAPGSGKTFMLISFIQSFLAKYPLARPLVILPKGILPTWKREFQRWQVEDIPLYDFYSVKADKRSEQLQVLNSWQGNKSILFLGYKQFSTIVCGSTTSKVAAACQERLLKVPSLLILDEGHTPRNEDTNVLESLAKVQTRRKVVLSGTLFQNHVREVFNILNLVRPKFLRMEHSRAIVRRVLSRVTISGVRKGALDAMFYELVEETLQNDDNFKRKVAIIRELRELTKDVLHYYKGDFLDELPGLTDFTVHLNLSPKQKEVIRKLPKYEKFKRRAVWTAVYIHPCLAEISEIAAGDRAASLSDARIDTLFESINVRDGVKAKFFLNILSLSESAGEKVLVFSQYILPLKFLERLLVRAKGWHVGKQIFMISGDSSSEEREWSMEQFNKSPDAKVLFGSIKACGEGISLVGASRVVILDVHLNPSVTRQAIGRAFRPGQENKVYTYRLVAADSPEEAIHDTSFKKEVISKMWFEWSDYNSSHQDFELQEVDITTCEDMLLETSTVREDIKALYQR